MQKHIQLVLKLCLCTILELHTLFMGNSSKIVNSDNLHYEGSYAMTCSYRSGNTHTADVYPKHADTALISVQ